jgi:hypothetical protein
MSTINTNGLNVNYPVPGQNNSTQGFRDNFTNIKNNLDVAGNEISDLQNKVVLKSALANSTLNNDMANTLISNASTLQFRATTYNLGNALSGTVIVDCSLGDVQFGNVQGNVTFQFGSWAPINTQSKIQLQVGRPNAETNYTLTFPNSAVFNDNTGWKLVENTSNTGNVTNISFPYDCTQINLTLTSNDCGNTIYVEPTNRPYKTTQVQNRTPNPVGGPGDTSGTIAADDDYLYVCTGDYDATILTGTGNAVSTTSGSNVITFDVNIQSAGVVANMPVVFDTMFINNVSVSSFGGINKGQVYYVKTVSTTDLTISDTRTSNVAGTTLSLTTQSAGINTYMDASFYSGTNIWKRTALSNW